jgi:type IV pilus assembly protein PilC
MAERYAYRVRDRRGALITGELVADSQELVMTRLREMNYIPLEIKQKREGLKREISLRPGKVKLKDLAIFSRQFATMVNSGLPLLRTLSILEEQTDNKVLARKLAEVRLDVERGSSLSGALARHEKTFPTLYVSMCRAGEASGTLDLVLLRLADTLEKEVSLRQKIKSAMTYPTVVFAMVILILAAMLLFVVPTFEDLYSSLGGTLPLPTRILLSLSDIARRFFLVFVGAAVAAVFLLRRWIKTDRGRAAFDRFKLRLPIFGSLFQKTALARFARTLGVLNRSGVPILQALDIVQETVKNEVVAKAVRDVQSGVKEGESIAGPLANHKVFPPMVVQMMAVGEETGALDTMLEKIADFYEEEVSTAVESLTSLIEPLLIAVVGGAVGLIVISLYLPLFRIVELIE